MKLKNEKETKKIIEEHNLKRNRIKAFLSYILNYMINEKKDKPLKTTVMKVVYLLHSKYNFRFVNFESYLYGPYSRTIDSILLDLSNNDVVALKHKISHNGYDYFVFESAKLPKELEKFLDGSEKEELKKALDEIYIEFSDKKNRLSLDKLLDHVYNKDKIYKESEFGEPIKFDETRNCL